MNTRKGAAGRTSIVMNNLKRFTVCKLMGHKWLSVAYPPVPTGRTQRPFSRAASDVARRTTTQERFPLLDGTTPVS